MAFSLILGVTSARAADIVTTHHFSANLALEGNVLVTGAGLGWPGIVALNAAAVLGIILCTLYWWRVPLPHALPPADRSLWGFASFNYFQRIYPPAAFLWKLSTAWPGNWRLFVQFVGVVVPVVLIAASALAVFSWEALFQWHWTAYHDLYHRFFPLFPYALLLPCYLAACTLFFHGEWRRSQAMAHVQ